MPEYAHISRLMPKSQTVLLPIVIAAATVNSMTMGYDTMMMSGFIAIPQYTNYFHLTAATTGLINASTWMGSIVSCLFMQYMADHYGRKTTIYVASLLSFVGVALQTASTNNMGMFIFARIVLGFCTELAGAASPLLVAEMSPKKIRGFMVGLYFTCFNAGAILASAVTYGSAYISGTWAWRLPSLLQAVPSAMCILLLLFVPELPRWLISKGKFEEAREIFQVSNSLLEAEAEDMLAEVQVAIQEEKTQTKGAWRELFRPTKANQRRLIIVFVLALVAELGGSSVGSYYFTVILEQAGITGTTRLLQINLISSCWNFACAVAGSYFFDYFGRKKQAVGTLVGMIVSFFLLGGFVKMYGNSTNHSGQYATIFFMFAFNGFYNFCITPLNCLYPSELFPMKTRASGATFFKFWNCGFGLLATFILPIAMDAIGWKFYIVNASYDIIFLVLVQIYWVETNGLSLEEIGAQLGEVPVVMGEVKTNESVTEILETVSEKK